MCQILSALERFCLQGLGTATSDLHLHGMEDKERKRGKLVPALRESDHVENFLLVPVASYETVLGLDMD